MKGTVICLILLLATSQAVRMLTNSEVRRIEELQQSNSWASVLLNLAELHLLAQGPTDELVKAIKEVLVDIEKKLDAATKAFDQRTTEHNSDVRRLTNLINECSKNIADTQALLANVLEPQKQQLIDEIANLKRIIKETQEHMEEATKQREKDHEDYLVRMEEHSQAIAAIDEANNLLKGLMIQQKGQSFAQITRTQKQVTSIVSKVHEKHFPEKDMLMALLSVSTEQFANKEALKKVMDMMDSVKSNLQKSIFTEGENEQKADTDFKNDMDRCVKLIKESREDLEQKQKELARTEEQIENAKQFILQRTADRAKFTQDLQDENDAYEKATKNFNNLVAQLDKETNACKSALGVIESAQFTDYISNRMSQDKVIDTAKGSTSGVKTGAGDIKFRN